MNETIDLLLALIGNHLFFHPLPQISERPLAEERLEPLYILAGKHDLAHIAADALYKNQLLPEKSAWTEKFQKAQMVALFRYTQMEQDVSKICKALQKAEIPYVPLKGIIIRPLYPQPYMRTSCDIDILVHREDASRAAGVLETALGYKKDPQAHFHDISLFSPNGNHLELHFSVESGRENMDTLLSQVWSYCAPVSEGSYEYRLTPEFFMFHQIAHAATHFLSGGCGIRPIADLYLLRRKYPYDDSAVAKLCASCHIEVFYEKIKTLSDVWFGGVPHTEYTHAMQDYILHGGVYGSMSNHVVIQHQEKGSKGAQLLHRVFMPYSLLKHKYPVLNKHKWLYPFMTVRRWFGLLSPTRRRHAQRELKSIISISETQQSKTAALLEDLGLSPSQLNP